MKATGTTDTVRIWVERITLATYRIGEPNKNPMFLEKRVYQGSSGVVYPYPVIDRIYDVKVDQTYEAVYLENRWIQIMVLPELGGRVQMALDKTNGCHFVYYNRVIKPALVGLAGPWISGGIEFNWPQHHRPNTFGPVDWRIVENGDGSKTLWCSEIDRMFRTKGMHGLTLHPNKAYLEIDVQLYNRTAEPQTFLWWANPAVSVNDDYQSVFPQDVHAVMDHGKRDVSSFPIATGVYYKVDYSPGTDISRYKNLPVPTSYMAYHSDYDFLGCYDHGRQAGMLHVANHHIAPGKKQWTWGHGDFGQAWDRQLTDEDGPYIELMCGCYTDNQPDFTWLMPYEQKSFKQYFMPYKEIGAAKNASIEAALNLEVRERTVRIGVYVTSPRHDLTIRLHRGDQVLFEMMGIAATPEEAVIEEIELEAPVPAHELTVRLYDACRREMLSFSPIKAHPDDIPEPAQPALPPAEIATTEQLFLAGQHLEQYRHATYDPQPYYEEALRRDPTDVRNNNALGLLYYRRGCFLEAEKHFRRAVKTLTQRNPNPYDGEPYYNLGLALRMQGRFDEAFDAFYKAVWNAAWQDAGYFELARIACRRGDLPATLELVERSLSRNGVNHKARHLKAAVLRHLGQLKQALDETERAQSLDPLDFGSLYESALTAAAQGQRAEAESRIALLDRLMRGNLHNTIELALDYAHAGLWSQAIALLQRCPDDDALRWYYLGWCKARAGDADGAQSAFDQAAVIRPGTVFPNQLECIEVFQTALRFCPLDGYASYHLGNYLFSRRAHECAIDAWERARYLHPDFPTVHRNLGLAYCNKRRDVSAARAAFEQAFALDATDARVLFELDQLFRKLNRSPNERLALLEAHPDLVAERDDLSIERIALLNRLARHKEALDILTQRQFHPWEGGEGKATGQYVFALVQAARAALDRRDYQDARDLLKRALVYPANLGEGKLPGAAENHIHYYLGLACEALGLTQEATGWLEKASVGLREPASAIYYNDQPPDTMYYQGLALQRLGHNREARTRFEALVEYGRAHLEDEPTMDYFAVSLPDFLVFDEDLGSRNRIHCLYMTGLGRLGLGQTREAMSCLNDVLERDGMHLGAWSVHPGRTRTT